MHGQRDDGGNGDEPEEDVIRFGTVVGHKPYVVRYDMPDEVRNDENAVPDAAQPTVFLAWLDVANPHGQETGDGSRQYKSEENGK